jgi:ActR/RegA family two-component response regulator
MAFYAERPTVLIAHPIPEIARTLREDFEKRNWLAYTSETAKTFLPMIDEITPNLIVSELRLRDGPCLSLLKQVRRDRPSISVVVLTGHDSVVSALECYREGITAYLRRGASVGEILAMAGGSNFVHETREVKPSHFDRLCWEYINRVVSYAGSISGAASLLGLDRRSLRRMLSKYAPPPSIL